MRRGPPLLYSEAAGKAWAEEYARTDSIYAVSEKFGVHAQTILHRLKTLGVHIKGRTKHSIATLQTAAEKRGGVCLSAEYHGIGKKYRFRCHRGHEWETRGNSLLRGDWCRKCANKDQECSLADLQQKAEAQGGRCLSTAYLGALQKHIFECSEGHVWEATWSNIYLGTWCALCADKAQLRTDGLAWIQELAAKREGTCLSAEYLGRHNKHKFRCHKGHEWSAQPGVMAYSDSWCPHCANKHSKAELAIFKAVKEQYPDALNGQRRLLPTKAFELDIYIPSLKKAIEYDGWHHSFYDGAADRDARKDAECLQVGIKLLRISEADYEANRPATIQRALDFLAVTL